MKHLVLELRDKRPTLQSGYKKRSGIWRLFFGFYNDRLSAKCVYSIDVYPDGSQVIRTDFEARQRAERLRKQAKKIMGS